jgi:hypothetical protein
VFFFHYPPFQIGLFIDLKKIRPSFGGPRRLVSTQTSGGEFK